MLTRPISRRRGDGLGELRHGMRRRAQAPESESIVRVWFGGRSRRLYAYRVMGAAAVGDLVEVVDAPVSGTVVVPVVALGRGRYRGPLKPARVIR